MQRRSKFDNEEFRESFGVNSANYNVKRFLRHRKSYGTDNYTVPTVDIARYKATDHQKYSTVIKQVIDGGFCFLSVDAEDGCNGIAAVHDYISNIPEVTQEYRERFAKNEQLSMETAGKFGRVPYASAHSHIALNTHNKHMWDKYLVKFQTALCVEMSTRENKKPVVGIAFFNTSRVSQPVRCIPGLLMKKYENNQVCEIVNEVAIKMTVDMMSEFMIPPGQIGWMNELIVHALHNNTQCRMTRIMYEFGIFPVEEKDSHETTFIAHRWSEVILCKKANLKFNKQDAKPHSDCCKQTSMWIQGKSAPIPADASALHENTNTIYKGSAIIGSTTRNQKAKKNTDPSQQMKPVSNFEGYAAVGFSWMTKSQRDKNTILFTEMFGPVCTDGYSIMKNRTLLNRDGKTEIIPWPAVNQNMEDGTPIPWRFFVHGKYAEEKFGESISYNRSTRMNGDYAWVDDEKNRFGYIAAPTATIKTNKKRRIVD